MNFSPVRKKRVYQEIVEQLKLKIEKGEIIPGEKLPSERILAEKFSVSRASVKEAFSVLEAAGVVEIRQGSGVYLLRNNTEDITTRIAAVIHGVSIDMVELMELRMAIERDAAYYATLRASDDDRQRIQKAFYALERAVNEHCVGAEEDLTFHLSIAKAASNTVFEKVMYMLHDHILEGLKDSRRDTKQIPNKSRIVLEEHRKIYEAIKIRDALQAREAMYSHLQHVKRRYL